MANCHWFSFDVLHQYFYTKGVMLRLEPPESIFFSIACAKPAPWDAAIFGTFSLFSVFPSSFCHPPRLFFSSVLLNVPLFYVWHSMRLSCAPGDIYFCLYLCTSYPCGLISLSRGNVSGGGGQVATWTLRFVFGTVHISCWKYCIFNVIFLCNSLFTMDSLCRRNLLFFKFAHSPGWVFVFFFRVSFFGKNCTKVQSHGADPRTTSFFQTFTPKQPFASHF